MTSQRGSSGFTLVELAIVIVILGILAALGTTAYSSMIDRARVVQAIGDIRAISFSVDDYYMRHGSYPETLADAGVDERLDPWGNPYEYLRIAGDAGNGNGNGNGNGGGNGGGGNGGGGGGVRKDKNLVPINTDYDLYSKGPDGESVAPLTAAASHDDIVRAANGGFIGLAENY